MALTNEEKFLLEKIFPNRRYDSLLDKYVIGLDVYLPLDLTPLEYNLLEKMCVENDIYLEKLPEKIDAQEGECLLEEYNRLKKRINSNIESKEKELLVRKKIEIRNKIALGYMEVVYKIIWKNYVDFESERQMDKEDIYQMGYETLLNFIDSYDPDRGLSFEMYVKLYTVAQIVKIASVEHKGYFSNTTRDLNRLNKAKKQVTDEGISLDKLSELTGFSKNKIKFLEKLETYSKEISLDELTSIDVTDVTVEEMLIDKTIKNNLIKLLDFLTEEEREIIKLYYGFYNNKEYSLDEISFVLGYNNRERVRQIKKGAIYKLKMPIYNIHISEMATDISVLESYLSSKKTIYQGKVINEYKAMILLSLPRQLLESLMKNISEDSRMILSLYLGLNGKRYNITNIGYKLKISYSKAKQMVYDALDEIKYQVSINTNKEYKDAQYYNYLAQKNFSRKK